MWTVIPFGWLWLASLLSSTVYVIYLIALIGAPATMVLDAWALHRLQAAYLRLRGRSPVSDADSMDADRRGRRKWRLLDVLSRRLGASSADRLPVLVLRTGRDALWHAMAR
jgi:hypothetical protein